jgi:hypothetical protein
MKDKLGGERGRSGLGVSQLPQGGGHDQHFRHVEDQG